MKIYLVQHAEAVSEEEDPARPLSREGRENALDVAELAEMMDLEVHQIRHSGKTRARQTAEIMGESLSPPGGVVEAPGLGPVDDVELVADQLDNLLEPVMLVGHLPFMERITGYMVAGDPELTVVKFINAAIVCLVKSDEGWHVSWILTPEIAAA
ncbi:MAG: phosphohistidine phosphatase SixA [Anaerolineae bacterium]